MSSHYLSAFFVFSPYFLILFLGVSIEIVLFKRLRRKQTSDKSLRERGSQISGTLVACRRRARMADMLFTYEVHGKRYRQLQHVSLETGKMANEGDAVVISYDVQKPENSLLKDIEREFGEVFPVTVLFLIMLMYGLVLVTTFIIVLIMNFL